MAIIDLNVALNTKDIVQSICDWNEARYAQKHDTELTLQLLEEELAETLTAIAKQDKTAILDGLGDIFYVATGALWKLGYPAESIKTFYDSAEEIQPLPPIPIAVNWYSISLDEQVLPIIAISAYKELAVILKSKIAALEVIRAICDSNDTKEVVFTQSNVKANISKGANYVSPTKSLERIARKYKYGL